MPDVDRKGRSRSGVSGGSRNALRREYGASVLSCSVLFESMESWAYRRGGDMHKGGMKMLEIARWLRLDDISHAKL